jgi:DNA repair exonuclease SbcCD ATPase subunit
LAQAVNDYQKGRLEMIFKNSTIWVFMLIGTLGITPLCYAETSSDKTSIEKVEQETQDLLRTLNAYTVDQRDEAIHKTKAALDNLDKRIDALEARIDEDWDKMDKAAREKARASLKALRKQRTQVAESYANLKNSFGDAWDHMKKGFSDAYKALNDAWEKSEREFGSNK